MGVGATLAASAALQVAGQLFESSAQAASARRQADMARAEAAWFAKMADWQVAVLEENLDRELAIMDRAGSIEMERLRRTRGLTEGVARARIGAAGVAAEGSPMEALRASVGQVEADMGVLRQNRAIARETMLRNVKIQKRSLEIQSEARQEGAMLTAGAYESRASDAFTAGLFRAGTTVLGAVTDYKLFNTRMDRMKVGA